MILLLSAQVLISLTLLVSGLAKLPDRTATAEAMISLRLPARSLHPIAAAVLPIAEIVLAIVVWFPNLVLQTVLAALTLLLFLAYLGIIGRALTFDEAVSCSCFGRLGSPTVSRATLGRNALLVVLAAVALISAATRTTGIAVIFAPLPTAALALVIAVTALLTGLTIDISRPVAEEGEAPAGASMSVAAATGAATAEGFPELPDDPAEMDALLDYERSRTPFGMLRQAGQEPITLRTLTRERAALLIWVKPGCGPCERVMSAVPSWQAKLGDVMTIRTLFRTAPEKLDSSVLERTGETTAQDIDGNLLDTFQARSTPSAVLLGADGMLAGGPVRGSNDVFGFVQEIIEQLDEARETGALPTA